MRSTDDDVPEGWLPRTKVAERLGVHKATLNRWVNGGQLREVRDDRDRAFYAPEDVARIEAERGHRNGGMSGSDDSDTEREPEPRTVAPRTAAKAPVEPGGMVLSARDVERLRRLLGGAAPTARAITSALKAWGARAGRWDELCGRLGAEPDVGELCAGLDAGLALEALRRDVERGEAVLLCGEDLRRYRSRVLQQLLAGDLVGVRVELLRELGLVDEGHETEECARVVWQRLTELRDEVGAARRAAVLSEMRRSAAVERVERLDGLLREAGFGGGVDALTAALASQLKERELARGVNEALGT